MSNGGDQVDSTREMHLKICEVTVKISKPIFILYNLLITKNHILFLIFRLLLKKLNYKKTEAITLQSHNRLDSFAWISTYFLQVSIIR